MKIATNYEMKNKAEMLKRRIQAGEEIATWCVQDENGGYDTYNGTYNQCLKEAKSLSREGEKIVGLVLMALDENLCADYCIKEVSAEEF